MTDAALVRAAGGVVVRDRDGAIEVLVVHRPKYDDWSLPKGKRDPGETDEQCAVREVEEETGVRAVLGPELLPIRYVDRRNRPKIVRYWLMRPVHETPFVPNDEIDAVEWVAAGAAADRLTYGYDAALLTSVRLSFTSRSLRPT